MSYEILATGHDTAGSFLSLQRSATCRLKPPHLNNTEKGYIALLGWSLNAVEAAEDFDRRYVVVAPDWAEDYCKQHDIPYIKWNFERLNDRSMEIAQTLKEQGWMWPFPCLRKPWNGPELSTRY